MSRYSWSTDVGEDLEREQQAAKEFQQQIEQERKEEEERRQRLAKHAAKKKTSDDTTGDPPDNNENRAGSDDNKPATPDRPNWTKYLFIALALIVIAFGFYLYNESSKANQLHVPANETGNALDNTSLDQNTSIALNTSVNGTGSMMMSNGMGNTSVTNETIIANSSSENASEPDPVDEEIKSALLGKLAASGDTANTSNQE